MRPPYSESPRKSAHDHIKNVPIWSYPTYYKNAPYISLGAHHNLATLATAGKIAMQFMLIASVHYNFTTWTPHLTSCIVYMNNASDQPLPYLSPKDVPVLSDTVQLQFTHPYSKRSCTIRRTQVPIVPTFVMTAHKAQGQSLKNVIIDLQSCSGTKAPYVMILRVTSLNGILLLRPFDWSKICCRRSQDSRQERERINILQLQTKVKHGTLTESANARQTLHGIGCGT
jgi:hypothetical protein